MDAPAPLGPRAGRPQRPFTLSLPRETVKIRAIRYYRTALITADRLAVVGAGINLFP